MDGWVGNWYCDGQMNYAIGVAYFYIMPPFFLFATTAQLFTRHSGKILPGITSRAMLTSLHLVLWFSSRNAFTEALNVHFVSKSWSRERQNGSQMT